MRSWIIGYDWASSCLSARIATLSTLPMNGSGALTMWHLNGVTQATHKPYTAMWPLGESQGLTVSVQGLPEYEVTADDQATYLYLTCLRCTGGLGTGVTSQHRKPNVWSDYEASAYLQFWQGQDP